MASIAAARCDGTILLHHGLIDHPPRIFTNLLSQVLGVMVSDGRGAHGMEIEEEEEDEFEQNGPTDGPANQSANTATAAAASDRATHCQTCGACFCEQGGAALAHHKRNCKPTYTFIQQGELSVELVFERTAMREVGGAPEACRPNRSIPANPCRYAVAAPCTAAMPCSFAVQGPFSPHDAPISKESKKLRVKTYALQFPSMHHCPSLYFH